MTRRATLALALLVVVAIVLAELLVEPEGRDHLRLMLMMVAPAVVVALAVPWARRWVRGRRSVAGAALAVALVSLVLGTAIATAASNAMFVSSRDYKIFLVVLLLSGGLALIVGQQLSQPLADDIRRVGEVAERVADGDLTAQTEVRRNDEVGRTAAAVDAMVHRLRDAEAERARLAAARRDLLTGVSHDLRTPLAAMRAAVESMQDGVATDPARYLAIVDAQLEVVQQLIDQLFVFARIEAGGEPAGRELVSLSELADDTIDALSPLADAAGVRLGAEAHESCTVDGRPGDLSRVLRNLVHNAIRHSPRDGIVRVRVDTDRADALVTVSDQGDGFPDDFRDRAFEPFTRADSARTVTGSTGLGLAIARALVDAHGGRIGIADDPHGVVWFTVPLAAPLAASEPSRAVRSAADTADSPSAPQAGSSASPTASTPR